MIKVKLWANGPTLYGKESARAFRKNFAPGIKYNTVTYFDFTGIKDITPGFVQDSFAPLYLLAKERGGSIRFENTQRYLRPILLQGIKNGIKK